MRWLRRKLAAWLWPEILALQQAREAAHQRDSRARADAGIIRAIKVSLRDFPRCP